MKKVIVLTGAANGIGREIARLYFAKGYHLVLNDMDGPGLGEFSENDNIDLVEGDITSDDIQNKIRDIIENKLQRLDILINNAGITYIQPFEHNTREQLDKIMEVNLKAPILLTQKLYPVMVRQQSGHIVFVNSTAGKEGRANHTMYSSAKFGLVGFAQSLRAEAKLHNIRVTSFHPGGVRTALYDHLDPKPDTSTYMDPQEVAKVLVFLTETEGLAPDEIVLNRMSK